jgi:hypothetical protein
MRIKNVFHSRFIDNVEVLGLTRRRALRPGRFLVVIYYRLIQIESQSVTGIVR